jgi:mannose-6-phosphate isomerase-like protein (cupin superfamily)
MHHRVRIVSIAIVLLLACLSSLAHSDNTMSEPGSSSESNAKSKAQPGGAMPSDTSGITSIVRLPCVAFTKRPARAHDPADLLYTFDQLAYWYRVPGEFTHRLDGDQYGFETLSFIISETHPGGGPGLHVHDMEEAHVLLQGSAQYRIGAKTFTAHAPYVAKVPAGVPHTFINVGGEPFQLIAVFGTKHPFTARVGPKPLIPAWERDQLVLPCSTAK